MALVVHIFEVSPIFFSMLHVAYLLLALWTDPNPLGGSFERWVQTVEVICSGTRATGLQVNATLASGAVLIVVDLTLQEKKDGLGKVKPFRTSLYSIQSLYCSRQAHSNKKSNCQKGPGPLWKKTEMMVYDSNKHKQTNKRPRSKFHELKQIEK